MSPSSDIARGNTESLAGSKGSADLPATLFPRDLGLLLEQHGPIHKTAPGRFVTISRRSKKTTHNRVTDYEKFDEKLLVERLLRPSRKMGTGRA
jgi:hypothetical protein